MNNTSRIGLGWEAVCGRKARYDHTDLEALLSSSSILRHSDHCTPTRFVSDDAFELLPHRRGQPLARLLAHFAAEGVSRTIVCLPHFLQLDPMVFWTHRSASIPHAAVSANQSLAIAVMTRELSPQCVIATPATARAFETALAVHGVSADFHWYLYCDVNSLDVIEGDRLTFIDACMLPGISSAYQCRDLASARAGEFHLAPEFSWRISEGCALATSRGHDLVSLTRYAACHVSDAHRVCPCGEKTHAL